MKLSMYALSAQRLIFPRQGTSIDLTVSVRDTPSNSHLDLVVRRRP